MKKTVLFTMALAFAAFASSASAGENISVTLDGQALGFASPPQLINDSVMVPMREIFEAIGADIEWEGETASAAAVKEARYVRFTDGKGSMELGVCRDGKNDGEKVLYKNIALNSEPVIIDDVMYVPMRAFAEAFNYSVEWDAETSTASITAPAEADGWIYYSSWSDGGHMYKADTNGQHRQLICDADCYAEVGTIAYSSGYLFFSERNSENKEEEGCLYRMKTDGTEKEKLTEKPVNLLYDNKEYKGHTADENGYLFYLEGEKGAMGYFDSGKVTYLNRVNAKTGEVTRVIEEPVERGSVYIYGDYIYFKYRSDKLDKMYTYYRADKNGENIINITGDIAAANYGLGFDRENNRIRFRSQAGYGTYYTAELDGSDVKEEDAQSIFSTSTYKGASYYGVDRIEHTGDGFIIGTKNDEKDTYYVIDEDGNELSSVTITIPEFSDSERISFRSRQDKVFYSFVETPDFERKKVIYVSDLDELLGKQYISVGEEKVDGKYEITLSPMGFDDYFLDIFPLKSETYTFNTDGSGHRLLFENYYLYEISDDKLTIMDTNNGDIYTCDLDGENLEFQSNFKSMLEAEHSAYESYRSGEPQSEEMPAGVLKENVHYGITVKNDGSVKAYEYNKW